MRKEVIGLTDGFGLPDFVLKAPIAKYDGDIYQCKYFVSHISFIIIKAFLGFI